MARRKYRMGEVECKGKTLTCSRGTMWPPMEVEIYGGVEEARVEVSSARYHAITIWQQGCGLSQVSTEKCPTCPYVLVDGSPPKVHQVKIYSTQATRLARAKRKHRDVKK
jgi:hypothetical protein